MVSFRAPDRHAAEFRILSVLLAGACASCGCDGADTRSAEPRPGVAAAGAPGHAALPRLVTRREIACADKPLGVLAHDVDGDGRAELFAVGHGSALHQWRALDETLVGGIELAPLPVGGYLVGPVLLERSSAPPVLAVASQATSELVLLDLGGGAEAVRSVPLDGVPQALGAGELGPNGPHVAVATAEPALQLVSLAGDTHRIDLPPMLPTCVHLLAGGTGFVVGDQERRAIHVQRLDPSGAAAGPPFAVPLGGIPRDVVEIDLDRDGDLELVVAAGDHDLVVLGFGSDAEGIDALERASQGEGLLRWRTGAIPIDLEAADIDGDGEDELVVLCFWEMTFQVMDDFGPDGPGAVHRDHAGQTPWAIAAGDFDGDGAVDLAVSNRDALRVSLVRGLPGGGLERVHNAPTSRSPRAIAAGDLDGDGLPEAMVLSSLDDALSLLRNADGRLQHGRRVATLGSFGDVHCADVDGDGHLDAAFLVRAPDGVSLALLFGDGEGRLAPRADVPLRPLGAGVTHLLLADLDADGRAELVHASPDTGWVTVLRPAPPGVAPFRYEEAASIEVGSGPAALAAIEREGRPLVLVGLEGGTRDGVVILAVGPDLGLEEVELLRLGERVRDVETGDLDGDGRADFAALTKGPVDVSGGSIHPFLATAGGGWRPLPVLRTSLNPYDLELGDLDGDGRADVVVSNQHSHHLNVWLSRGGQQPGFLRLADVGVGNGPLGIALVDVDGDERLDVLSANHFSDDISTVYNRDGNGARAGDEAGAR